MKYMLLRKGVRVLGTPQRLLDGTQPGELQHQRDDATPPPRQRALSVGALQRPLSRVVASEGEFASRTQRGA